MPIRSAALHTSCVLAALLVAGAAAPAPAVAGPPWISVELPANPLDRSTRDAFLLVRTYHHANIVSARLTGRAIGIVNGERRTMALSFERTNTPGVYALHRSWPAEGSWALAIHFGEGAEASATALVGIAADGEVRSIRVPTHEEGDRRWPRPVGEDEIERTLSLVAAMPPASEQERERQAGLPLGVGVLVLGIGAGVMLRRRGGR